LALGPAAFTGPVPWDAICGLANLTYLQLGPNPRLAPGPIGPCLCDRLPALATLALPDTQRTGRIPGCLGAAAATTLRIVTLSGNQLEGAAVPAGLCRLRGLEVLLVNGNPGVGGVLPGCLQDLANLTELNLLDTRVAAPLPAALFTLPELTYLLISHAELAGTGLPQTAAADAAPPGAHWLPKIKLLALPSCQLAGPIPAWVGQLPNLAAVVLSGNAFSGAIPVFANTTKLSQFAAARNQLTGTLAPLRGAARTLQKLDVSYNRIGGEVPGWLAARSGEMPTLAIDVNHLSCALPADFAAPAAAAAGTAAAVSAAWRASHTRSASAVEPSVHASSSAATHVSSATPPTHRTR